MDQIRLDIGVVIAAVIAAFGYLWRRIDNLRKDNETMHEAEKRTDGDRRRQSYERMELIQKQMHALETKMLSEFPTKADLKDMETRLLSAIGKHT